VFPELLKRNTLVPLVELLKVQHVRGRMVTDEILRLSNKGQGGLALMRSLRSFERMYRPHAAREDTVVFPAFRAALGRYGYAEIGSRMEIEEHRALGDRGFERTVAEVAKIEAALRIDDLSQFTPS
jgi:hypothetical protein